MTAVGQTALDLLLNEYVAAEDALRAFTDQNVGRLCAICARWTLLAARTNAAAADAPGETQGAQIGTNEVEVPGRGGASSGGGLPRHLRGVGAAPVTWRLSSWVTNCCNANHALESMSDDSLAGVVATRAEGREWWRKVKRAEAAPCSALTDQGCALSRGRPELCNTYFCEAVRDYLWHLGGEERGPALAAQLDELQRRWGRLYTIYGNAIAALRLGERVDVARVRGTSGIRDFAPFLERFSREIGTVSRPVNAKLVAERLFKVSGEREIYEPFFERELEAIEGTIRQ